MLTGTQLGAYGRDLDEGGSLVGPARARAEGDVGPADPPVVAAAAGRYPRAARSLEDPRLCRHFHIALQSGSDAVLARMRRRYTAREFAEARRRDKRAVSRMPRSPPTCSSASPARPTQDFAATQRFCREAGFAALHVFPFSARPGTLAAKMPDQVSAATKRARVQEMLGRRAKSFAGGFWRASRAA